MASVTAATASLRTAAPLSIHCATLGKYVTVSVSVYVCVCVVCVCVCACVCASVCVLDAGEGRSVVV